QLVDDVVRDAAAHEPDRVGAENARGPAADGARVRQRVLRHHRIAADEAVRSDAAELVDGRSRADVRVVLDGDVAAERRMRTENRVVADVAVVGHMDVGHEDVAIADAGRPAAAARGSTSAAGWMAVRSGRSPSSSTHSATI